MIRFTKRAAADVSTPAANKVTLFIDDTGVTKIKNESGTVSSVGGGVAESLLDAKGDLIVASAADTAARLAVGTDGQVLTAASGQATGLQWATPSGTPVWTDYTPALTASSSNPTMGSGSVAVGRYVQNGETISGWARIVFGTGMAAGSGTYRISLPVAPKTETVERVVGSTFHWIGTGGSVPAGAAAIPASATYVAIRAGGIHVDSGAGWVATGEINISFTYEAA